MTMPTSRTKRTAKVAVMLAAGILLSGLGCKKTDDSSAQFKTAINTYYASRPACLWDAPVRFPVQVSTSDQTQTQGYDALLDQGLLARTTAEKRIFILGSKQVTNYDLTARGRAAWTPDPQQPGAGNFCLGKPTVTSVTPVTPPTNQPAQPGQTATVNFQYQITGVPAWALAPETQTAYPNLRALAQMPQSGTAQLTNESTTGWTVTHASAAAFAGAPAPGNKASDAAVTPADSEIVH